MHQRSHPPSRRLVLQTKTNDGLTLWGRTSPRHHASSLSLGFIGIHKLEALQSSDSCSYVMDRATCGPLGHVLQSTTMRSWKPGSAKTSEEPRFLSPLEGSVGRNRLSQVVLWHLPCGKYWLEDPLSGLCLARRRSRKLDSGLYSRRRFVTTKVLNRILVCKPLEQRCAIAVLN